MLDRRVVACHHHMMSMPLPNFKKGREDYCGRCSVTIWVLDSIPEELKLIYWDRIVLTPIFNNTKQSMFDQIEHRSEDLLRRRSGTDNNLNQKSVTIYWPNSSSRTSMQVKKKLGTITLYIKLAIAT